MSGLMLVVGNMCYLIIVTVPVLQVELLLLVLLETAISVNQPQNTHLKINGTQITRCGKAIAMLVVIVVQTRVYIYIQSSEGPLVTVIYASCMLL